VKTAGSEGKHLSSENGNINVFAINPYVAIIQQLVLKGFIKEIWTPQKMTRQIVTTNLGMHTMYGFNHIYKCITLPLTKTYYRETDIIMRQTSTKWIVFGPH